MKKTLLAATLVATLVGSTVYANVKDTLAIEWNHAQAKLQAAEASIQRLVAKSKEKEDGDNERWIQHFKAASDDLRTKIKGIDNDTTLVKRDRLMLQQQYLTNLALMRIELLLFEQNQLLKKEKK